MMMGAPRVPPLRLWLVFFMDADDAAWWARLMPAGWRHVCAAAWLPDHERWLLFSPSRRRLEVEVMTADEFLPVFKYMHEHAAAVLRVAGRKERWHAPALAYCVGQVKSLLGVRCFAVTPRGLYRDLLRRGAEVVRAPGAGRNRPVAYSN